MLILAMRTPHFRPERIVAVVCDLWEVELGELCGDGRHAEVTHARRVAAWACRQLTRASYPEIARAMGRRNHTTARQQHLSFDREAGCLEKRRTLRRILQALEQDPRRADGILFDRPCHPQISGRLAAKFLSNHRGGAETRSEPGTESHGGFA